MFKTQAPSLADELIEADKLSTVPSDPSELPDKATDRHRSALTARRRLPFSPYSNKTLDKLTSPEEKIMNTDFDSGVSTTHSPICAKSGCYSNVNGICSQIDSPASSSGISTSTVESLEATHRGLHKFFPRHLGELEVEIGDPLYIQREADDLWCEGINLRTGKNGIVPSAYVTDVEYTEFDPECVQVQRERFVLKFLGSIEVTCHKGNDVLCQAVRKIADAEQGCGHYPHVCTLEISDQGLRMVDKGKPAQNHVPCHDYFFSLKNISFCGFHPHDNRYFGFITKHPTMHRFACHIFVGDESTRPVAESVGRAFERFYQKFMETVYPIEDMYLE